MIKLETIKRIADDILSDVEWVNDSHSEAEYKGVKDGLNRLIRHIEYTHNDDQLINDELIAEFMGLEEHKGSYYIKDEWIYNVDLEYDESWDWLMPVANKIIKSRDEQNSDWDLTDLKYGLQRTSIDIVYKAVIEFIKTYNKTK